ncbi:anti-sigma factor antagonist [Brachyspira suanatina]|uniref:Anti-sigma factor antagonist n=1 Tax=Brachyspira suanatina TaxID=381802 RepID=A0A0G4K7Q1_9SPIR|nr:STAS domain-containing protein [Brachyspira suanatina]CRF33813.1 anti-sigma factor antagonist [Brachyspira suanatina]
MAIEFNNEYISIVMEANLATPEEIKSFVEDSDEACNIRMPVVVLDMKNVREINSAGIAKILKLYKNLQSLKVKLFMINLDESVKPTIKSLMIFSLIKYFDDPKDFTI